MNWTCAQIEERLSDYLDGQLAATERREFDAHVSGCSRCAPLLRSVSSMVGRMRTLDALEPPSDLVSRILDQTVGPRAAERKAWPAWLGWLRPSWEPRLVLGGVTVMATFLIVFQAIGVRPSKLTVADLSPANIVRNVNRHAHLVYGRGVKFVDDLRVVYEIQSRLRPEAAPGPSPEPQAPPPPPTTNPSQKSEHESRPGRSANWNMPVFAEALTFDTRSFR